MAESIPFFKAWIYIWFYVIRIVLSLDTSGSISACQFENFIHGYHVEVSFDRVLQAGSRNRELDRCLRIISV